MGKKHQCNEGGMETSTVLPLPMITIWSITFTINGTPISELSCFSLMPSP